MCGCAQVAAGPVAHGGMATGILQRIRDSEALCLCVRQWESPQ